MIHLRKVSLVSLVLTALRREQRRPLFSAAESNSSRGTMRKAESTWLIWERSTTSSLTLHESLLELSAAVLNINTSEVIMKVQRSNPSAPHCFFLRDGSVVEFQETTECADSSVPVMEDCSVQTCHPERIHFNSARHIARTPIGWFSCESQMQKLPCHRSRRGCTVHRFL